MYICNIFLLYGGVCIEVWFIVWDLCSNVLVDFSIKECLYVLWMFINLVGCIFLLKGCDEEEIDWENFIFDIEIVV